MEDDQTCQLELRLLVMKLTKRAGDNKGIYKMLNTIMKRAGEGYYYALFTDYEIDRFALDFLQGCGFGVTQDAILSKPHHTQPRKLQRYYTITWQQ